jgi:hypothetical protein
MPVLLQQLIEEGYYASQMGDTQNVENSIFEAHISMRWRQNFFEHLLSDAFDWSRNVYSFYRNVPDSNLGQDTECLGRGCNFPRIFMHI